MGCWARWDRVGRRRTFRRSAGAAGRRIGDVEDLADAVAELVEREPLDPVVGHARGEPFQPGVGVAQVREHHDLHARRGGFVPEPLEDLQPVDDRHPDVEDQERRPCSRTSSDGLRPVARLPDLVPVAAEDSA